MNDNNYIISVPWQSQTNPWWNETCAMVVQVFGLPGDRYRWKPDENKMDFCFANSKDADLCKILLSERLGD